MQLVIPTTSRASRPMPRDFALRQRGSMKMPREDDTRPLPGHMRFGDDHESRLTTGCGILSSCSYILARTGLFGTSRLIQGRCSIEDVGIGILWVRFRDGIIFPTDPGDPSFSFRSDGRVHDVEASSGERSHC